MTRSQTSHEKRESPVLADLEASFPNFAGQSFSWISVPKHQDPPDFISRSAKGAIGLELVEWLDGKQMGPAKARESRREQIDRLLAADWESQYKPRNFRGAFLSLRENEKIARRDEVLLRKQFFSCATEVDRNWAGLTERGNSYYQTQFSNYPLLEKYFNSVRYLGGEPHGLCWIHEQGDGGAYDPNVVVETLQHAVERKLTRYRTSEKQRHLSAHHLTELDLVVHGGFNIFAYNTPRGNLSLEVIARRASNYYSLLVERQIFNHVWFFHSLDSADDLNQLLGFAPGAGRVRWLAQLWPDFRIYPGSIPNSAI
jgi:hypothetical protein